MKSKTLALLCITPCIAFASPTPKPVPTIKSTPVPASTAKVTPARTPAKQFELQSSSQAALLAADIVSKVNAAIAAADLMNNGRQQQGDREPVTAQQIQAHIPAETVVKIQAMANAAR
jgi:hypothetical protein